jgi:hypothetical protein
MRGMASPLRERHAAIVRAALARFRRTPYTPPADDTEAKVDARSRAKDKAKAAGRNRASLHAAKRKPFL